MHNWKEKKNIEPSESPKQHDDGQRTEQTKESDFKFCLNKFKQ